MLRIHHACKICLERRIIFQEGGHGFGIRLIAGKPAAVWPYLVLAFGRRNGWITA